MNNKSYFVHPSSFIDLPCTIGNNTKIWHFSHIMPNCVIGENCIIGQNVLVASNVKLGNNVKVQNNVSIYEGVVCEDDVFLGPSMVFTNVINPRATIIRKSEFKATLVRKGASIGANATIICGVEIGCYAMIGAGAVITKNVKPFALMVGNPARHTAWVSEYGHKLNFNDNNEAICPENKDKYILSENKVRKA